MEAIEFHGQQGHRLRTPPQLRIASVIDSYFELLLRASSVKPYEREIYENQVQKEGRLLRSLLERVGIEEVEMRLPQVTRSHFRAMRSALEML